MFTGIIECTGTLHCRRIQGQDLSLDIHSGSLDLTRTALGDSIAVNGVCLTVTAIDGALFSVDVSAETLDKTTVGDWREGTLLNLEAALRVGDPLGGHLVSGHVDARAELREIKDQGRSTRMRFAVPKGLARFIAHKGSVTLDGVSLTVNRVDGVEFEVNLVPHTLRITNLGQRALGDALNFEVDSIARYVDRALQCRTQETP